MSFTPLPVPVQALALAGQSTGAATLLSLSGYVPQTAKAVLLYCTNFSTSATLHRVAIGSSAMFTVLPTARLEQAIATVTQGHYLIIPLDQDISIKYQFQAGTAASLALSVFVAGYFE